jgi:hypothetical protein|tara:strand:+ start:1533 stop:3410 length:1878 start_codon:yes stop_codon:yes gene_type:complete
MPDRWQTYPLEFTGGLISNLSPLQHGITAPGSARTLINFEPSTDGGYRRIEGFEKFNSNTVTGIGNILGVVFYRDRAIVARDQSGGSNAPKLFAGGITGSFVDLSTSLTLGLNSSRVRFVRYNFTGSDKLYIVDGIGYPLILNGVTASDLSQLSSPSDIQGASHVAQFKDHIFLAKGTNLIFSAPFSDTDFTSASGGGIINVGDTVTAIIPFREQLIIFSESSINRLVGSSQGEFKMQPIASDIGCLAGETVQEISGDIIFLGPDGLRTLAGTEKNQDFDLGAISKPIQKEMVSLTSSNTSFSSVVIREKSQYRLFGFNSSTTTALSKGIIGTQLQTAQGIGINWAETTGIRAYVSDSVYVGKTEVILFANDDGYIYKMESGNSFDGTDITASFSTPFFPISDPRIRKTIYRASIYTDPQGSVTLDFNLKYDLSAEGVIEPETITLSNASASGGVFVFGNSSSVLAHGAEINNNGGYSAGVTSMAVDNLSTSDIVSGDTFQILVGDSSSANFKKTYTLSSTPSISNNATTLSFSPALAADVVDNTTDNSTNPPSNVMYKDASIVFLTVNLEDATSTFSGESLKSIFDTQTLGSGFTVSLQFESSGTTPPFAMDAAVIEYGQYGRR